MLIVPQANPALLSGGRYSNDRLSTILTRSKPVELVNSLRSWVTPDEETGKVNTVDEETGKVLEFSNQVMGGSVPSNYIPAVEKGFLEACEKGPLSGNPVTGCRLVYEDGGLACGSTSPCSLHAVQRLLHTSLHTKTARTQSGKGNDRNDWKGCSDQTDSIAS